jgi:hypothetical protein
MAQCTAELDLHSIDQLDPSEQMLGAQEQAFSDLVANYAEDILIRTEKAMQYMDAYEM